MKLFGKVEALYVRQMNSFLPMLIARFFRVPTFFEIPNDPFIAYRMRGRLRGLIEQQIDRWAMRLSDRIVVLSDWSKERLQRLGGVRLSKIVVFPSGTDTALFRPLPKAECCAKLGLDFSKIHIGFIGSFLAYQGIDRLIDAAPRILKRHNEARFILVGDGPMMDEWRKTTRVRGLHDYFIFTGAVPYKTVPDYIGAMDICVAPHHRTSNQASPVKIFDYMACAKPVVASDLEVVREIAGESEAVVLVKPEDSEELAAAILSLAGNPSLRAELARKAREYAVKHFDRHELTKRVMEELLHGEQPE